MTHANFYKNLIFFHRNSSCTIRCRFVSYYNKILVKISGYISELWLISKIRSTDDYIRQDARDIRWNFEGPKQWDKIYLS